MAVETFIVDSVDWLKNVRFDEIVYGKPGQVVLYCVLGIIWLYFALMVYKDAEHRYLEGAKVKYYWLGVVLLTGPLGWLAYLALRPAVDLDESYLQKVEERYLSFESRGLGYCAKCGEGVDPDFLFCAGCGTRIRSRCGKCDRIVEKMFEYCPSCGEKMEGKPSVAVLSVNEVETADKLRAGKGQEMIKKGGEEGAKAVAHGKVVPFTQFMKGKVVSGMAKVSGGVKGFFAKFKRHKPERAPEPEIESEPKLGQEKEWDPDTKSSDELKEEQETPMPEPESFVEPSTKKSKRKRNRKKKKKVKQEAQEVLAEVESAQP